jgi:hypothetical protein
MKIDKKVFKVWNKGMNGQEYKKHFKNGMGGQFKKGQKHKNPLKKGTHNSIKTEFKKGHKRPEEWTKKQREKVSEEKNWQWKGENASYTAKHRWVIKWKGLANHCEVCGDDKKKVYHWANIDHKYRRVLEDYISACVSCHRKYDRDKLKK